MNYRGNYRPRAVVTTTVPMTIDAFCSELIRNLARHHDVHVVSSPGPELTSLAARLGVSPHSLHMNRGISPISDVVALARWVTMLVRLRPSVVLTLTPKASLLSMLASWIARVPARVYILVGLRLEGEQGGRRVVLTATERLTVFAATAVVANSPSLRDAAVAQGLVSRCKIESTIPGSSHGIDVNHFRPRPADKTLALSLGLRTDCPVLGFVGRVTKDKGIDDLAAASALMVRTGVEHQLLIVGSHDEHDSSAQLIRLKQLTVNVVFVEHTTDVRPYFALMDIHVLPTLREGFPNVVLEAAAMQVPTVTTRATGAIDSVREGETGLLVAPGCPAQLAGAITTLLRNPHRRNAMGRAGRAWACRDFDPMDVTESLLTAAGILL